MPLNKMPGIENGMNHQQTHQFSYRSKKFWWSSTLIPQFKFIIQLFPAIKHLPDKQFRCYVKSVIRKIVTMCRIIKSEINVVYGLDDTMLRCLDRNSTKTFK